MASPPTTKLPTKPVSKNLGNVLKPSVI
jgi:hypothetical protein